MTFICLVTSKLDLLKVAEAVLQKSLRIINIRQFSLVLTTRLRWLINTDFKGTQRVVGNGSFLQMNNLNLINNTEAYNTFYILLSCSKELPGSIHHFQNLLIVITENAQELKQLSNNGYKDMPH